MEIAFDDIIVSLKGNISDSMSDEEFLDFCRNNDFIRIERDENKQIIVMAPVNISTGYQNTNILGELITWNKKENKGVCFDSSTGFTLPDGSVRSPDASWLTIERWKELSDTDKNKFAPVCPDFVIELKSKSDNIKNLMNKMQKWIDNGCRLAWLINPDTQEVFIYRGDGTISKINGFKNVLSGEDVLTGFQLDLSILS